MVKVVVRRIGLEMEKPVGRMFNESEEVPETGKR